ncbi:MAG: KH domain-containing protein [Patescibacteria group bacterium]|jgi:spoIIIJ-associated protein|nr:KH domain-containing protein [Patescibacteria group bacterium]
MDESVIFAKKYLEDLLSFFGLNTDVHVTTEDEVIQLSVPSTHMNGFLIGQRGETIRSLQYILSMALKSKELEYTRVNIDIAEYKKHHQDKIADMAVEWMQKVKETGEPMHLKPMNPADRRVVHKVASEYELETHSEGEGRDRHVVLTKPETSE